MDSAGASSDAAARTSVSLMELVTGRPNVELRRAADGERVVVLSFPYDRALVDLVRTIPHRRFDWETREWSAPAEDWAALKVVEALERYPELSVAPDVGEWLADVGRRWIGAVTTTRYDGRGWWVLRTLAGSVPGELRDGAIERADGALLVPISQVAARVLREQRSMRVDMGAERCLQVAEHGGDPPAARLIWFRSVDGEQLRLEVLWDPDVGVAFGELPGADGTRAVPLDPWLAEPLTRSSPVTASR